MTLKNYQSIVGAYLVNTALLYYIIDFESK